MGQPDGRHQARLGAVQETLFIPLAARARETEKKHPVLTDPKAAELVRSIDYDAAKYGRGAGGLLALDTYPKRTFDQQHRLAARKGIDARWAWSCDDPRSLERFGLEVMESVTITRPPRAMRSQLPARYRYLLPLAHPLLSQAMAITLFRCGR